MQLRSPHKCNSRPPARQGVQPAGLDDPVTTSAAGPQPVSPPELTADENSKIAPANLNGSQIDGSHINGSQINGLQINGSQKTGATQTSNTEAAKSAQATNAGLAANEELRNGHADSPPESKKEHAAVTSAASRVGLQNSEPLSTPHAEAHAGEIAQAGKTPDGVQLLNMQHPADRFAAAASPAAQSASAQDAAAAAVPLAGLAVEIVAHAQAGRNRFEIRLDPPELGRIDVRLDIDRSGQVTSRLTVERVETLDALRRDAGDLERALQQAGLKTADNGLQFALRDHSFASRDQSFPTTAAARVVIPNPELAAIDAMPAGYGRMLRPGGGIDIRV
jgi:flagellar hook-length control protein FliK